MRVFRFLFRFFALIYPYKFHCKLQSARDFFYTLWIRNFIGRLGEHSRICYPCSLQGGGQKNISIGDYTTIQGTSILGCWTKYGNQQFPTASITIGNHCSIGEYNHITACKYSTIASRPKIQRRGRHRKQCVAWRQSCGAVRSAYWKQRDCGG